MKRRSGVWNHFNIIAEETAECTECSKQFVYKQGNTTNLKRHLRRLHGIISEETQNVAGKRRKIDIDDDEKLTDGEENMQSPTQASQKDEHQFYIEFIDQYAQLPSLWDANNQNFNDNEEKKKDMSILISKYQEFFPNATQKMVKRKINNFRNKYRDELKKKKDSDNSEGGGYKSSFKYFDSLDFLKSQPEFQQESSDDEVQVEYPKYNTRFSNHNIGNKREYREYNNIPAVSKSDDENVMRKQITDIYKRLNRQEQLMTNIVNSRLNQPKRETECLAAAWAFSLDKMALNQQIIAKRAINEIILEGMVGSLRQDSVQINTKETTITVADYITSFSVAANDINERQETVIQSAP